MIVLSVPSTLAAQSQSPVFAEFPSLSGRKLRLLDPLPEVDSFLKNALTSRLDTRGVALPWRFMGLFGDDDPIASKTRQLPLRPQDGFPLSRSDHRAAQEMLC
jgi:hypothetical protein